MVPTTNPNAKSESGAGPMANDNTNGGQTDNATAENMP